MKMKLIIFLCLVCHGVALVSASGTYNVMDFGAKADGVTDDSQAFLAAWKRACSSSGQTKVWVPVGTYFLNPVEFFGPCPDVQNLIFHFQGTVKASTDLDKFKQTRGWVAFVLVDHLTLTGGGTFHGQGEVSWPSAECPKQKDCTPLPSSLSFMYTNNTIVKDITSINSKFFHVVLIGCNKFQGSGITIKAPEDSPNTDGIHLESSSGVTISSSNIGTGDDCISIGQGNSDVTVNEINCGPGHGISVGSLGRYDYEKDVKHLIVKNSTFIGTVTGARIKTWANSPVQTTAQNITFDNLIMKNVGYPILIDQTYCPYPNCESSVPSRVQLTDVTFKDIRGTTQYREAITLKCSKGLPCQVVKLDNINLQSSDTHTIVTVCDNAHVIYSGQINPARCN